MLLMCHRLMKETDKLTRLSLYTPPTITLLDIKLEWKLSGVEMDLKHIGELSLSTRRGLFVTCHHLFFLVPAPLTVDKKLVSHCKCGKNSAPPL